MHQSPLFMRSQSHEGDGGKLGAACDGMPETFITIIYIMSNPMSHSQNTITFFIALVNKAMFPEIKNIYHNIVQSISFETKLRQNIERNNSWEGNLMGFREGDSLEKNIMWLLHLHMVYKK